MLLIHAERDPLISVRHAHRLVAAARRWEDEFKRITLPARSIAVRTDMIRNSYMALVQQFLAA